MDRKRLATLLILLVSVAVAFEACDSSSVFYSDADRKSIYTVAFTGESGKLASGATVQPGAVLTVAITRMAGSSTPETVRLELLGGDGAARASLSYTTAKTAKALGAGQTGVTVESLSDALPSFSLPKDLEPGDYTLRSVLLDQYAESLQENETVLFVAPRDFSSGALSFYPPNPAPGQAVLLQAASVRGQDGEKLDPWIRWSSEGRVFASGPLSEGFDKVVWRAPSAEGAYAVNVELFPVRPSAAAEAESSPWHTEIKAFVAKPAMALTDLFGKDAQFPRRLSFEGAMADLGTEAQGEAPSPIGKPSLETYPGGFGIRLDASSGVALPAFLLPAKAGQPLPCSLVWRAYLDGSEGDLLIVVDQDGTPVFRVALEAGNPVIELKDGLDPEPVRSRSETVVAPGYHELALSLVPEEKGYSFLWTIDGAREAPVSLPAPGLDTECVARLGGATGLPGVYDDFALSDDSDGAPPFLKVAAERRWKTDLLVAEGFESAPDATKIQVKGTAVAGLRSFSLGAKASLGLLQDLPLSRPLAFDVGYSTPDASLEAVLLLDGAAFLRVAQDGDLVLPDGSVAGMVAQRDRGRLVFRIKVTPESVELSSADDLPVARIKTKSPPRLLRLTLQNPASEGAVSLSSVLVRAAPELLSAADAPRMARAR